MFNLYTLSHGVIKVDAVEYLSVFAACSYSFMFKSRLFKKTNQISSYIHFVQVNRIVENCSSLQRLRLFGGRESVSGQALAGLANLSQLRELDLGLCVNVSQHTL